MHSSDMRRPRRRRRGLSALAAVCLAVVAGLLPTAGGALAAAPSVEVRLPLGRHISGTVTSPSGAPVAGAHIDATDDIVFVSATTSVDGTYILHGVRNSAYRVYASVAPEVFVAEYYGVPDSTADYYSASMVTVDGADVSGIDIRLGAKPLTGISGTIRDPAGQPVGGVTVQASGYPSSGSTTSDADGSYRIDALEAGDYRLYIQPQQGSDFYAGPAVDGTVGLPSSDPTVVTVGDSDTTGIDIALVRGRTITGRLTTARPALVGAYASGPGSGQATVDGSGVFSIHGLIPGQYQVVFLDVLPGPGQNDAGNFPYGSYGPGGTMVGQNDGIAVDVTDADATLDPVSIPRGTDIIGQVTDGKIGLANANLVVCDSLHFLGCASVNSGAHGSFRVPHVPSGNFTIFTSALRRVAGYYRPNGFSIDDVGAGAVQVVGTGPDVKGIRIVLPAGGTVIGRVTGPANEPVLGATVSVYPFGIPPVFLQPITGSDGGFRQTGIPTNTYGLGVQAPEGSDYLSGYYLAGAAGDYTADYLVGTTFRVIEDHDRGAPTITFRDPASGARTVGIDTVFSVRFSEPVDRISSSTMQLRDARGHLVPATVAFTPNDRTAHLAPSAGLQPGTRYRLTLASAIVDWSGNHLAEASWSITTSP